MPRHTTSLFVCLLFVASFLSSLVCASGNALIFYTDDEVSQENQQTFYLRSVNKEKILDELIYQATGKTHAIDPKYNVNSAIRAMTTQSDAKKNLSYVFKTKKTDQYKSSKKCEFKAIPLLDGSYRDPLYRVALTYNKSLFDKKKKIFYIYTPSVYNREAFKTILRDIKVKNSAGKTATYEDFVLHFFAFLLKKQTYIAKKIQSIRFGIPYTGASDTLYEHWGGYVVVDLNRNKLGENLRIFTSDKMGAYKDVAIIKQLKALINNIDPKDKSGLFTKVKAIFNKAGATPFQQVLINQTTTGLGIGEHTNKQNAQKKKWQKIAKKAGGGVVFVVGTAALIRYLSGENIVTPINEENNTNDENTEGESEYKIARLNT